MHGSLPKSHTSKQTWNGTLMNILLGSGLKYMLLLRKSRAGIDQESSRLQRMHGAFTLDSLHHNSRIPEGFWTADLRVLVWEY